MNRSNLDVKSTISFLLATVVAASCCNAVVAQGQLKFVSIKPTVFFVREDNILTQIGEATISNSSQEKVQIALQTRIPGKRMKEISATVPEGTTTVKFSFPSIAEPTPVTFILTLGGREHDRHSMTWQPQRHWQVFFVPITHHDLGYTDTIENILLDYDGFYDDVLRFCEETEDWPAESKYRYTVEGTWSIQHFIENRPKQTIEKLAKYIKQGRIEVGAFFGHEITAMCSHEELIRMMYPSFRFKRKYGASISSAAITDMPGLSWGLPTVMAGAGVKYFFAGFPTYFEWGRNDIHTFWDESAILRHGRPDAFRWQGPDGETVLVYYQGSYGFFGPEFDNAQWKRNVTGPNSYKYVMARLPGELMKMQEAGTPFSVMRYCHNGLDNYPPDVQISHVVRQWNSKWAYPKLFVATHSMFFEALEKQCQNVRTFRGELPHTDYAVGAISTAKQTGINRVTRERLQSAEKFSTIASLVGNDSYPAEDIRRTYDDVLFYDLHCWGLAYPAGKVQDWNWNEKSRHAYRAAGMTERMLSRSLDRIVNSVELKDTEGQNDVWYIDVGSNATNMQVVMTCGSNDYDVFGRLGSVPTRSTNDWKAEATGGEDYSYPNPGAGRWYIVVDALSGSGSYTLTVTITDGSSTPTPTPAPTPTGGNRLTSGVQVNGSLQGRHIVVFNSLAFERTDVVRVPRFTVEGLPDLIDEETGRKVPYQIVELDSPQAPIPYAANRYGRGQFGRRELFDMVFIAEDVPSLGYKTYRLSPKDKAASFSSSVVVGDRSLENRFFRVTLDPQAGTVESIYDKELSRELVERDAPHKLNQFIAKWVKTGKQESPNKARIRKGQSGPVYGSLVVSGQGAGCPQLTQEIILYDKVKRIDFANRILKDSTPLLEIYFAFPFKMDNPDFRFEGSNSVIKPLRDQLPGSNSNYYALQHWADVSDRNIGITLSPIESHLLEFGGLWPCYVSQAHHGVTPPDFGREFVKASELTKGYMYSFVINTNFCTNFETVQQADMLFRYSITTHKGGWKEARPRDFGWAIGNPLIAVGVNGKREGMLDKKMSFCRVDKPNVLLLTLKRAEDGDGIIIRLIETQGKATTASVTLPHIAVAEAVVTNLVEENKGRAAFTEHEIQVNLKAFGITTIRIKTD